MANKICSRCIYKDQCANGIAPGDSFLVDLCKYIELQSDGEYQVVIMGEIINRISSTDTEELIDGCN